MGSGVLHFRDGPNPQGGEDALVLPVARIPEAATRGVPVPRVSPLSQPRHSKRQIPTRPSVRPMTLFRSRRTARSG